MKRFMLLTMGVVSLLADACRLDTTPGNGSQLCAETAKDMCHSGFYCASDGFCWKNGSGPDASVDPSLEAGATGGTGAQPDDASVPPSSGRALGEMCANNGQCSSGVCADGFCCNKTCSDTCFACNVPGNEGSCVPVTRGSAPSSSGQCPADASKPCGYTGTCDGTGKCLQAEAGKVCGAPSCDTATYMLTPASTCDGQGICKPSAAAVSCAPAKCNGASNGCASPCMGSADCIAPNQCAASSCGPSKLGVPCGADNECESKHCVDGVCCDKACQGQCEACDLGGGMCKPVTGTPHRVASPMRALCGGQEACPGACDGVKTDSCVYPANQCRPQACASGVVAVVNKAMCNAVGECPPATTTPCMFSCIASACTACNPGTKSCASADRPQTCNNSGRWVQDPVCNVGPANSSPTCSGNGSCGYQCLGGTPVLSCANSALKFCGLWEFESLTEEGWAKGSSVPNVVSGALNAQEVTLAGEKRRVLVVPVRLAAMSGGQQATVRVTPCPGSTFKLKNMTTRLYVAMPSSMYNVSATVQVLSATSRDTPTEGPIKLNEWVTVTGGFIASGPAMVASSVEILFFISNKTAAPPDALIYVDNVQLELQP